MKPRAFVVMPFGSKPVRPAVPAAEGRPAQEAIFVDFTELYRRLLKPALEGAGCEPFRADQESAAGDIRTDMFFELVTADLVVADISILNPNVFYELGLRHGVSPRGVIHIHGGWEKQPFDVAPDRTSSTTARCGPPGRRATPCGRSTWARQGCRGLRPEVRPAPECARRRRSSALLRVE